MNQTYGAPAARFVVLAGFLAGCPLSLLTCSPRVACASATSFLVSQMLETYVFDRLARAQRPPGHRRSRWWVPQLTSSTLASALDSALFSALALSGTGLPWVTLGAGDFIVKSVYAVVALIPFRAALAVLGK